MRNLQSVLLGVTLSLIVMQVAYAQVYLATELGNSSFEDDFDHSEWTATKKSANYLLDAPEVNPMIIPKGETNPLVAPVGDNFVGILNPDDEDISGRLVHEAHTAVPVPFPSGTVFEVTVFANRGRLEDASSSAFTGPASELSLQFFGWGSGRLPVVNPNTDDWSRRPSVKLTQTFTNWTANGTWASQTFQFVSNSALQYISLAITGKHHINASYVAFDIDETP